ncbi:MAG: bifunctional phosphoribosyl-AMP cyclohydrolase/phosphoribosyl-ATP diphosphatase HisIE [Chloroflexota bacterium]
MMATAALQNVKFDKSGLVPAIVQHAESGHVLMLGYMNAESLQRTIESGLVWFYSRSRQRLWQKGETSDNVLRVRSLFLDCDGDTILVQADPAGPTCHTGAPSCFFTPLQDQAGTPPSFEVADDLFATILQRIRENPDGSYVSKLVASGVDRVSKKIGEEATEVVIAAKNHDKDEIAREMADLWFHSMILLASEGMTPADVWAELHRRRK